MGRASAKTVTVLFADVTGSTALGEQLDPESLRRVMARYFDVARTCLERQGGTVEKFIGDAVMAVFGVPIVHEDDALRALRAAADLRDSLASLNDELSVADEFLNCSALALEAPSRSVEVARQHTAERLRVELLTERRRAGRGTRVEGESEASPCVPALAGR